ncbi:MAG TPA: winged helix-turn-helix domain-containing protein [Candidatus Nanoarchaeia archaeon]|nr:winged helix-turn-helix domain-containing protein [Candidatus Nanoarchaeia archaeon]
MFGVEQKILLHKIRKPLRKNLNEDLQWIGRSFGFFNPRDKDRSMFRLFIELLQASKHKQELSSEHIAQLLNISRGTVVHHLNKLIEAGIVVENRNRYKLRVDSLELLVDELERDIKRNFEDIKEVARDVDSMMER